MTATQTVAVIRNKRGDDVCHRIDCRDLTKERAYSDVYWTASSLAEAEASYNEDLGVDAGYEEPWVWNLHVTVYPCTKGL